MWNFVAFKKVVPTVAYLSPLGPIWWEAETNNEEPPQDQDAEEQRRISARVQMSDPFIVSLVKESQGDGARIPRDALGAGSRSMLRKFIAAEIVVAVKGCLPVRHAYWSRTSQTRCTASSVQIWTERRYWKPMLLRQLGYVYQQGHDASKIVILVFMPASAQQRCFDDEEHHLRRLASYRKYRRANLEDRQEKTRRRMAELRERETAAERAARYREQIAHRAWRAAIKRNEAEGKLTKLRPAMRQYYSDPELITDDEEEEQDGW
ncbi:hypothetical protein B0H13DRAFT_1907425 [Mycena leptocephala]|nr:hypothetical protein B0H13DRAFT_1907425 [Mycena leptocephala]